MLWGKRPPDREANAPRALHHTSFFVHIVFYRPYRRAPTCRQNLMSFIVVLSIVLRAPQRNGRLTFLVLRTYTIRPHPFISKHIFCASLYSVLFCSLSSIALRMYMSVPSCHVMSCPVLSSCVLFYSVLSCSCLVLSCPVMSCHVMSCPVPSCRLS